MVKYPELAKLMAVVGMSKKELAEIISKAPSAVTEKLEGKTDFKWTEVREITKYFKERYPEIELTYSGIKLTSDFIFSEIGYYSKQNQKGA